MPEDLSCWLRSQKSFEKLFEFIVVKKLSSMLDSLSSRREGPGGKAGACSNGISMGARKESMGDVRMLFHPETRAKSKKEPNVNGMKLTAKWTSGWRGGSPSTYFRTGAIHCHKRRLDTKRGDGGDMFWVRKDCSERSRAAMTGAKRSCLVKIRGMSFVRDIIKMVGFDWEDVRSPSSAKRRISGKVKIKKTEEKRDDCHAPRR